MVIYDPNQYKKQFCGGKASSLFTLIENGLQVPPFVVIPSFILKEIVEQHKVDVTDLKALEACITQVKDSVFPIEEIVKRLGNPNWFAIRSSASDEDGNQHSFAGQYNSYLFVSRDKLAAHIKKVWLSALSDHIITYRQTNALPLFVPVSVIIQTMVEAEVSGVAFAINPVTGNRKEQLVSAVYGLGEGLVSGELNADTFTISGDHIQSNIATKEFMLVKTPVGGLTKVQVDNINQKKHTLTEAQILEVKEAVLTCSKIYSKPQDIEFAYHQNNLFILQSRPITTLSKTPDISANRIVWDNSNIIESYPGVTTPLTFSFILKSYESAYRLFLEYLGATPKEIDDNKTVFANTLGLINGRVYYNLKSWYQMLAMVPGYSINAGFMENMMGVKEKFELPQHQRLSKSKAWWRTIKMLLKMYIRYKSIPRKRKAFKKLLDKTIEEYKSIDFSQKSACELKELYLRFEKTLLNKWKAPLLNDFFAMICFGMLQKKCSKYGLNKNNPNIHNDLLCGSSDIISVEPIHRTIEIASSILQHIECKNWFTSKSDEEVWLDLKKGVFPEVYQKLQQYINDFGERCVGELKLETVSYTQNPALFIAVVRSYVDNNITKKNTGGNIELELRQKAFSEVNTVLKYRWYKKYRFNKTLNKARDMVSNRENLRYERTRAFGIVRELFSHIGRDFYAEGILDEKQDIFYLTKEEIFSYLEGTSVTQNLKQLIATRKKEFDGYKDLPPTAERLETFGAVYHGNDFFSLHKVQSLSGDLKGIGCCPGKIRAKVQVIHHPKEISSLNGDILVTTSTDPGWVTLFPGAGGILVERGSLLSHSAIVAREMGKPCIVGITGLMRTLKTGDLVEMDGRTGAITIVESKSN